MKKNTKRYLSLLLTLALVLTIPFAFTQEASAASKKGKTKYVVTSTTRISEDEIFTYKCNYYKNGLIKEEVFSDSSKNVFSRNKKGYMTAFTEYNAKGERGYAESFTYQYNKKGQPAKKTIYIVSHNENGGTESFTYYKNGKLKKSVYQSPEGDYSYTVTFNKKGHVTSTVSKGQGSLYVEKYSYKYDKKGNPTKIVSTETWNESGNSGSSTKTEKYKYKYDKHKNIKQAVITTTGTNDSGKPYKDVTTYKYKYKKVKVPKKYLKVFDNPPASGLYNKAQGPNTPY